jgi:hypothetical protein
MPLTSILIDALHMALTSILLSPSQSYSCSSMHAPLCSSAGQKPFQSQSALGLPQASAAESLSCHALACDVGPPYVLLRGAKRLNGISRRPCTPTQHGHTSSHTTPTPNPIRASLQSIFSAQTKTETRSTNSLP